MFYKSSNFLKMNCLICGHLEKHDPARITLGGAVALCNTIGINPTKVAQLAEEIQRCRVCTNCAIKVHEVSFLTEEVGKLQVAAETFQKYFINRLSNPAKEETKEKRAFLDKSPSAIRLKHQRTKGLRRSIKKGLGLKSGRRNMLNQTFPVLIKPNVAVNEPVTNELPKDQNILQPPTTNILANTNISILPSLPPGQLFLISNPLMNFLGINELNQPILLNNGIVNLDSTYTVLGEVISTDGSVTLTSTSGENAEVSNGNDTAGKEFLESLQPDQVNLDTPGEKEEEHNGLDILDDSSAPFEIVNILSPNINVDSPELYPHSMPSPDNNITFTIPNAH